jgi:hypothetical protein
MAGPPLANTEEMAMSAKSKQGNRVFMTQDVFAKLHAEA